MIELHDSLRKLYEQPNLKFIPLGVEFKKDYPEDHVCPFCGSEAHKANVYACFNYNDHGNPVAAEGELPGYKCDSCELDTIYLPFGIKGYEQALELAKMAGDEVAARQFEDSIRVFNL